MSQVSYISISPRVKYFEMIQQIRKVNLSEKIPHKDILISLAKDRIKHFCCSYFLKKVVVCILRRRFFITISQNFPCRAPLSDCV